MTPFPSGSSVRFQLFFYTEAKGWRAWSGRYELRTDVEGAWMKKECRKQHPDVEFAVVRVTETMDRVDR